MRTGLQPRGYQELPRVTLRTYGEAGSNSPFDENQETLFYEALSHVIDSIEHFERLNTFNYRNINDNLKPLEHPIRFSMSIKERPWRVLFSDGCRSIVIHFPSEHLPFYEILKQLVEDGCTLPFEANIRHFLNSSYLSHSNKMKSVRKEIEAYVKQEKEQLYND